MLNAICGAQSVGKTTVVNELKKHGIETLGKITRDLAAKGFLINEAGTDDTQLAILEAHIERSKLTGNILLDRCILDGIVYTHYLYEEGQVSLETLNKYMDMFGEAIVGYENIFYIRPEFDITDDGERSTNIAFRDRIVELFEKYIEMKL
jgi:predicted ATPase